MAPPAVAGRSLNPILDQERIPRPNAFVGRHLRRIAYPNCVAYMLNCVFPWMRCAFALATMESGPASVLGSIGT
jgi:hypothetical protein